MAGASAERQENKFVSSINNLVKKNGVAIKIKAGGTTIKNVTKADKFQGRQVSGSEPYIDVQLTLHNGKKVGLSMKGPSAPSLAGGGLKGINLAVPGLADRFMKGAFKHLEKKIEPGDKVPDVYGEVAGMFKEKIVVGNKDMGGPIDFMYIGAMDPVTRYDKNTNCLEFTNGKLTEAKKYAKEKRLYFRLRARRVDQVFDPNAKDSKGIPKIYSKSPSRGDSASRIMVTDSVPTNARENTITVR